MRLKKKKKTWLWNLYQTGQTGIDASLLICSIYVRLSFCRGHHSDGGLYFLTTPAVAPLRPLLALPVVNKTRMNQSLSPLRLSLPFFLFLSSVPGDLLPSLVLKSRTKLDVQKIKSFYERYTKKKKKMNREGVIVKTLRSSVILS